MNAVDKSYFGLHTLFSVKAYVGSNPTRATILNIFNKYLGLYQLNYVIDTFIGNVIYQARVQMALHGTKFSDLRKTEFAV